MVILDIQENEEHYKLIQLYTIRCSFAILAADKNSFVNWIGFRLKLHPQQSGNFINSLYASNDVTAFYATFCISNLNFNVHSLINQ